MIIKDYNFPDNLFYDKNHFWATVEDGIVIMGATDLTQKLAGEITYVDIINEGDEVVQGKPFGSIESGKWVGRIYAVISGNILMNNNALEDKPELINQDCYGCGWICKISPYNLISELNILMKGDSYKQWIQSELNRIEAEMK